MRKFADWVFCLVEQIAERNFVRENVSLKNEIERLVKVNRYWHDRVESLVTQVEILEDIIQNWEESLEEVR